MPFELFVRMHKCQHCGTKFRLEKNAIRCESQGKPTQKFGKGQRVYNKGEWHHMVFGKVLDSRIVQGYRGKHVWELYIEWENVPRGVRHCQWFREDIVHAA